jgi:hypothetical protein
MGDQECEQVRSSGLRGVPSGSLTMGRFPPRSAIPSRRGGDPGPTDDRDQGDRRAQGRGYRARSSPDRRWGLSAWRPKNTVPGVETEVSTPGTDDSFITRLGAIAKRNRRFVFAFFRALFVDCSDTSPTLVSLAVGRKGRKTQFPVSRPKPQPRELMGALYHLRRYSKPKIQDSFRVSGSLHRLSRDRCRGRSHMRGVCPPDDLACPQPKRRIPAFGNLRSPRLHNRSHPCDPGM